MVAATATMLFTAGGMLVTSGAHAEPGSDTLTAADIANMSVPQLELELSRATANVQSTMREAAVAAEEYNKAKAALDDAEATVAKADEDAEKAKADYEAGRKELASVAQTAYRSGGTSLDVIAPYLGSDGLRTVEARERTLSNFGNAADTRMQRVAALQQVSEIMADAAVKARDVQKKAADEVQARLEEANAASESAASAMRTIQDRKDEVVAELARKQRTSVEAIEKRQSEIEARQVMATATQEQKAQQSTPSASTPASTPAPTPTPSPSTPAPKPTPAPQPAPTPAPAPKPTPAPTPAPSGGPSARALRAIEVAKGMLGRPYQWGGVGNPGYDCSGLVMVAYGAAGVNFLHGSQAQYRWGAYGGQYVPLSQAIPGDLVFWGASGETSYHVAIYLGNNQIIEAPMPGMNVHISSLWGGSQIVPWVVRVP